MLGARFDQIDFSDDLDTASDLDEGKLSPMVGLVIAPTRNFSIYANAGESFAPGSPRVQGEIAPEESRQLEVGVKKRFLDGQMRTTFAVYQLDRKNIDLTFEIDDGLPQLVLPARRHLCREPHADRVHQPRRSLHLPGKLRDHGVPDRVLSVQR